MSKSNTDVYHLISRHPDLPETLLMTYSKVKLNSKQTVISIKIKPAFYPSYSICMYDFPEINRAPLFEITGSLY
jgi:hypothetical protein